MFGCCGGRSLRVMGRPGKFIHRTFIFGVLPERVMLGAYLHCRRSGAYIFVVGTSVECCEM